MERVVAAATKALDGRIFTGIIHDEARELAGEAYAFDDGFVTSAGRYVGREEALTLAVASRQAVVSVDRDTLCSGDIRI